MKRNLVAGLLAMMMVLSAVPTSVRAEEITLTDGKGTGQSTISASVSPITTVDVTVPVGGLSFAIDSEGQITSQGIVIESNTAVPLNVNVLSVESLDAGDTTDGLTETTVKAPELVDVDTYTADEWNNMTRAQTAAEIALSIKQVDVNGDGTVGSALTDATTDAKKVTTPVKLGVGAGSQVAHLESGFSDTATCGINLETDVAYTNYGKAWVDTDDIVFRYLATLEFAFEN